MKYQVQTDKWAIVRAEEDGKPLIIRLNQGVSAIRGHADFAHQVGIAIPLHSPNHIGFPDGTEADELTALQDVLIPELERDQESVLTLVLTGDGVREFVLYTQAPESALSKIKALAPKVTTHEVQAMAQPDPDWLVYDTYAV